jgi:hypothetical protein
LGDGVLGIFYFLFFFLRDTILDFAKNILPLVKPKLLKLYANIRRCCKSHAAPFNLLFHNISTNLNGATESLATYTVNGATKIKNRFPF